MMRTAVKEDAREILGIYSHYVENTSISFEYEVPSLKEMEKRIEENIEKYAYLVLEENHHLLGYAYGSQYRGRKAYERTVEVSVYVHKDHVHEGYGKLLLKELLSALKKKGMVTAIAVITSENEQSNKAFASMGFTYSGHLPQVGYKFGSWHGINHYYKIL